MNESVTGIPKYDFTILIQAHSIFDWKVKDRYEKIIKFKKILDRRASTVKFQMLQV